MTKTSIKFEILKIAYTEDDENRIHILVVKNVP